MYVYYVDADSGQWVQSSGDGGGGGTTTLAGLLDTDTSGVVDGEILVYRSATGNWTAEAMPAGGVSSVAGRTGDVILVKADISDFNEADYATAAQGALADSALQPGDNISELTNDAGYITAAEVPPTGVTQLVAGDNITIDPAGGTGVVTINATLPTGGGTLDGGNFNTGVDTADGTAQLDGGIFT